MTVPAAGEYELDLLEEETGGGTADILVNGVLLKTGPPPVENRAASPDAGGWSVTGIFPLDAGKNTLRLEHKSRFPYFEKLLLAPNPLPKGSPAPLIEYPDCAAVRNQSRIPGSLGGGAAQIEGRAAFRAFCVVRISGATFVGRKISERLDFARREAVPRLPPETAEELAARYQELWNEADAQWLALWKRLSPTDEKRKLEDAAKDLAPKTGPMLSDASLEAVARASVRESRAVPRSRRSQSNIFPRQLKSNWLPSRKPARNSKTRSPIFRARWA